MEIMTISSSNTDSHLSFDPLFSCIITLYALIFLYFPHYLTHFLSPVLILTALLLLFLLRLGSVQRLQTQYPRHGHGEVAVQRNGIEVEKCVAREAETGFDPNPSPDFEEWFVGWDVKAPLEVIYEGEGGDEDDEHQDPDPTRFTALDRYPSLSMYYPETDSDTSSEGDLPMDGIRVSPERGCFMWEEEDREGLLIEIELDRNEKMDTGSDLGFHVEEENLIEIDISPPPKTTSSADCECD